MRSTRVPLTADVLAKETVKYFVNDHADSNTIKSLIPGLREISQQYVSQWSMTNLYYKFTGKLQIINAINELINYLQIIGNKSVYDLEAKIAVICRLYKFLLDDLPVSKNVDINCAFIGLIINQHKKNVGEDLKVTSDDILNILSQDSGKVFINALDIAVKLAVARMRHGEVSVTPNSDSDDSESSARSLKSQLIDEILHEESPRPQLAKAKPGYNFLHLFGVPVLFGDPSDIMLYRPPSEDNEGSANDPNYVGPGFY